MEKIVDLDDRRPSKLSEVICVKCGRRWLSVRPIGTLLKDLECPYCGLQGFTIETGEDLPDIKEGGIIE